MTNQIFKLLGSGNENIGFISKNEDEKPILTLKDLEINGTDLITMDIKPGLMIGKILNALLEGVIDGKISNTKKELKNHVINLTKKRHKKFK